MKKEVSKNNTNEVNNKNSTDHFVFERNGLKAYFVSSNKEYSEKNAKEVFMNVFLRTYNRTLAEKENDGGITNEKSNV